jgi:hypothetical protein
MVEMVEQTVKMPKEAKEVKDALLVLVQAMKAKKPVSEIIAMELPVAMKAIDGFEKIAEEAKTPEIAMVFGVMGGEIGQVLMTKV